MWIKGRHVEWSEVQDVNGDTAAIVLFAGVWDGGRWITARIEADDYEGQEWSATLTPTGGKEQRETFRSNGAAAEWCERQFEKLLAEMV